MGMAESASRRVVRDRHQCVLVTLDEKNAFNSAPWLLIDVAAARFGLPTYLRQLLRSYLEEITVLFLERGEYAEWEITYGVPQDSVLGLTLWNMFYDGLLKIPLPHGAALLGFAFNVALVVINHTTEWIEAIANASLGLVETLMHENGLTLAHSVTEAVMLTRSWAYRQLNLFFGEWRVVISRMVNYLGVRLDSRFLFTVHLRAASAATVSLAKAVGRLLPNIGGLSIAKRRL